MHEQDALDRRLRLAYLVLCLAYMGWALWTVMVPEHRRTELKLRLLRSCGQGMSRLARRTGEASMARELATGAEQYGLPYRLSLWRDAIGHAYDRHRDVTP